jgi:hypothetical protein
MVAKIEDIIDNMKSILFWAKYEDEDEDEKQRLEPGTLGDIERSRGQLRRPPSGGGGTPNWSAKVGQIIIGNLMRGEGGRFANATNIAKITRMLDDQGITPNMFQGMQSLLAGERGAVGAQTMANLLDAGLINESGVVQARAGEIINAIKTGNPDNLRRVFNPPSGGGGGGGGGGASEKKPTKEEREAANVDKLMPEIVARTALTQEQISALIDFFDGADLPDVQVEGLVNAGLVAEDADGNLYMTAAGRSLVRNMRQGDLREALDAVSRDVGKPEEEEGDEEDNDEEAQANILDVSSDTLENGVMTQAQINTLLGFDENEDDVSGESLADLIELGLVDLTKNGDFFMTGRGQSLILRMRGGDSQDALDTIARAQVAFDNRRESAKQNRAAAAESLIDDEITSREQADALIRGWTDADTSDVNADAIAQLETIGLTNADGELTAYGKWFMRALDVGGADVAQDVLNRLTEEKSLAGWKSLGGNWFITWTTNAFEDREGETFTTKSIENYLSAVDENGVDGQEYDFWHIDGSEFADVKWVGGQGRFLVEVGKFKDTPVGQAFKAFFNKYPRGHPDIAPYGWGCSHQYVYYPPDRGDHTYEWFSKQKSTVLPLSEAANPFTLAEFGLGEKAMELSEKQRRGLSVIAQEVGILDLEDRIVALGNDYTQFLEGQGVQYKGMKATPDFKKYTYNGVSVQATGRRSSDRDDKAYVRTVKQDGEEYLVHYADPDMPMRRTDKEARDAFNSRHSCGEKKNPRSAGFWSCYDWNNPDEKSMHEEEKARWSTAYVNDLPDSAFLWIAPGGKEDEEGKTVPRSLRYFPYKNHEGKVDLPHVRNAIARIPQAKHERLTASKKEELQARARRLLEENKGRTDKGGDMNREEIAEKMQDLADGMPEEQKEDWGEAAEKVSQPESDVTAIHRMLMEMVAELPEEQRMQAEELITALAEIASAEEEMDDVEMEPEPESLSEEEMAVTSDGQEEEKGLDTDGLVSELVEALDLRGLSEMLKTQHESIESMQAGLRSMAERVESLETEAERMTRVEDEVKRVKEQTENIVGEKKLFSPFWGNGVHVGSVAREEELTDEQHKAYRKPEVPSVIAGMRNRIRNS